MTFAKRAVPGSTLVLSACDGPQSALVGAGYEAAKIVELFWWMAAGAAVIWIAVVAFAVYAARSTPEKHNERLAKVLIVGGGAAFPTIVLTLLLLYGLSLMPGLRAPGEAGGPVIEVSGEQWWWRVRYLTPEGPPVELANEIRLPVGERIELRLSSPDVIHSFWVPSIAGKMDLIPGRVTRLVLEPTRTGTFRGACAEYCGASHALMAFYTVVVERPDFDRWLEEQRAPAAAPSEPLAARGGEVFLETGCGACHAVRGTPADGVVGPDLTHVGSRVSLAAATLDNEPEDFELWIAETKQVKPEVHMPRFGMLAKDELSALAAYLDGLR